MKKHLELTQIKSVQQELLLKQLPSWNGIQLDENLESLQKNGFITLSTDNSSKRKISIIMSSEMAVNRKSILLTDSEKILLTILSLYISK